MTLCTQNVDGFHQRAGSTDVIELHGNIRRTKCSRENIAIDQWAAVVEINPTFTPLTARATFVLHGASGEILPALIKAVW